MMIALSLGHHVSAESLSLSVVGKNRDQRVKAVRRAKERGRDCREKGRDSVTTVTDGLMR